MRTIEPFPNAICNRFGSSKLPRRSHLKLAAALLAFGFAALAFAADQQSPSPLDKLPRVKAKIEAREPVTIIGLGDSITTYYGNNSRNSGYYQVPPEVSYYGVFGSYIKRSFPGAEVKTINKGIGGETADRGLKRVESDVLSQNPDLVFVMYGANDGRGNRDMELFKSELSQIVGKIKASGSDVILVAPTMSLADLAWLLPCREQVLSLGDKLGCPVLDGTMALWPVDEKAESLADAAYYLSLHFPPNGDDIHPGFNGHFQMGRRLWNQLSAAAPQARLSFSFVQEPQFPGPIPCKLIAKNISDKPFKGSFQVFFPHEMPVAWTKCEEIELPNRAKENRRCLPLADLELEPGDSKEISSWALEMPSPEGLLEDNAQKQWLEGKNGAGVAVFSKERNEIFYVKPAEAPLAVKINGPRRAASLGSLSFTAEFSNKSGEAFEGSWRLVGAKDWKPITLPPKDWAKERFAFSFEGKAAEEGIASLGVELKNPSGKILAADAVKLDASPCVFALPLAADIDGELADWSKASWQNFKAGPTDASFAVAKNADCLLVALKAKDATPLFQFPNIWTGDGFELYVDARPEAQLGTPGPLWQIGLFPPKNKGSKLILMPGNGATKESMASIKSAWKLTDDGYQIEVAIPTKLFAPEGLKEGQLIGFSVACDEVAEKDKKRVQYLWAGSKANFATPVDYGFLRWGAGEQLWRISLLR